MTDEGVIRITLEGPAVTITGVVEEDILSGRYQELLSRAVKEAREIYLCDMIERNCPRKAALRNCTVEEKKNIPLWIIQS